MLRIGWQICDEAYFVLYGRLVIRSHYRAVFYKTELSCSPYKLEQTFKCNDLILDSATVSRIMMKIICTRFQTQHHQNISNQGEVKGTIERCWVLDCDSEVLDCDSES